MSEWTISFAITGHGFATVEADTEEEAIKNFNNGELVKNYEIDDWEVNSNEQRLGYIEALEDNSK